MENFIFCAATEKKFDAGFAEKYIMENYIIC